LGEIEQINAEKINLFQQNLLEWYQKNKRDYPWRNEHDPYKILVAEVMLQRTRADQVVPVYTSFLKKFPNVIALASARLEEIGSFVSLLGLFWKSALIKDMARTIVKEYDGVIPSDRQQLITIPGIGDYIADAMLVFAFKKKAVVVDSNVIRLVSRYYGIPVKGEMRRNRKFVRFCQSLLSGLQDSKIRDFNWALIDHPSSVCRPSPLCGKCPLSRMCTYYIEEN
jgi:A/G-specific adenine glycosylase